MKTAHVIFFLAVGASALYAADSKTEEVAIRSAIAMDHADLTADGIFWSGAYKRPTVGSEKGEEFPDHAMSKRSNMKVTTDVQRIEVAASGDMAYEFSYGTLDYDLAGPSPQHFAIKNSLLRVWKKVGGEWKVAAFFVRPLDLDFVPPAATATR